MKKTFVCIFAFVFINFTVVDSSIPGCKKSIGNICYEESSYPFITDEIYSRWEQNPDKLTKVFGPIKKELHPYRHHKITPSCRLCETSFIKRIQPTSVWHNNEKMLVLSLRSYPAPIIEVQSCSKNSKCILEDQENDFIARCMTKVTQINILAYNLNSQLFQTHNMTYPSSCECLMQPV